MYGHSGNIQHYIAGLYYRLSQEDERQGESVSIDNQRTILRKYAEEKPKPNVVGLWTAVTIREMLNKIIYIGHMPQLRWTSLSYKNHKRFRKDESEWTVVYNNHEPIISQELWDKTKVGYTHPLSGFLFCADCGNKMKLCTSVSRKGTRLYHFDCGYHLRYGKAYCFSHYIAASALEEIVLGDIREMAQRIVLDEKAVRDDFIRHNAELANQAIKSTKKELQVKRKRTEELSRLMQVAYNGREECESDTRICSKSVKDGQRSRPVKYL